MRHSTHLLKVVLLGLLAFVVSSIGAGQVVPASAATNVSFTPDISPQGDNGSPYPVTICFQPAGTNPADSNPYCVVVAEEGQGDFEVPMEADTDYVITARTATNNYYAIPNTVTTPPFRSPLLSRIVLQPANTVQNVQAVQETARVNDEITFAVGGTFFGSAGAGASILVTLPEGFSMSGVDAECTLDQGGVLVPCPQDIEAGPNGASFSLQHDGKQSVVLTYTGIVSAEASGAELTVTATTSIDSFGPTQTGTATTVIEELPTPEPTPTVSPTATPEPTATAMPTPTQEPTATPQPAPTVEPTVTTEPTATSQPTVEPTATLDPTPLPTVEATATSAPTIDPTATVAATETVAPTVAPEPTAPPMATPVVPDEPTPDPEPTSASVQEATIAPTPPQTGGGTEPPSVPTPTSRARFDISTFDGNPIPSTARLCIEGQGRSCASSLLPRSPPGRLPGPLCLWNAEAISR